MRDQGMQPSGLTRRRVLGEMGIASLAPQELAGR